MATNPGFGVNILDPTVASADQGVYEVSTTPKTALGTRLRLGDRTFYYAQASASFGAGAVVCAATCVASHQSGIFVVASTNGAATVISGTSSAAVTANYYAEGYYGISTLTGAGQLYRIRANAAGSTGFAITLYDGLAQNITSGVGHFLVPNPFKVFVGLQGSNTPIGVAPIDVTSGGYFWMQTWGVCAPKHVAATPLSACLHLGTTGGVVATFDATTNGGIAAVAYQIGKNIGLAASAGQNNPVFISILP